MATPLVTVGVPAYNHGKYITYLLESIRSQTFQDFEIIVVDDGSTDDTLAQARAFSDPRLRVIAHPRNLGPSAAANTYIREARGKYIAGIPSDDAMLPEKLARQVAYLDANPNCAVVFSRQRFIGEDNQPTEQPHFASRIFDYTNRSRAEWLRYFFDTGNCLPGATGLMRAESLRTVGELHPSLLQMQDYDLWVRLVLAGFDLHIVPDILCEYRIRDGETRNLSAASPATIRRSLWEYGRVLGNYAQHLSQPDALRAMLPDANPPAGLSPALEAAWVRHTLAEHAWQVGTPAHRTFALDQWAALMDTPDACICLPEWGMDTRAFYTRTADNPLGIAIEKRWDRWMYARLCAVLPKGVESNLRMFLKRFHALRR